MTVNKPVTLWQMVSQVPHRLFFATGCFFLILPVVWWTHLLIIQNMGISYPMSVVPKEAHAFFMIYGMTTQFILGFAMTVFPRWLDEEAIHPMQYKAIFFLMISGFILFTLGLALGKWVVAAGAFVITVGFVTTSMILWQVLKNSKMPDKLQANITWIAIASGGLGSFAYCLYSLFPEQYLLYRICYGLGVYFYIPMVILAVAYRMVPFFTSVVLKEFEAVRIPWVLKVWCAFWGLKALFFIFDFSQGYLLSDSVLLIATIIQFRKWAFGQKKPVMLLSYLYHSMIWFPISNLIFIFAGAYALLEGYPNPMLELAGLHALTIGGISSMIYSMATRVSLGHSGRPLVTNRFEDGMFWLLQGAVVSRVGFELMGLVDVSWIQYNYISGILWTLAFLPWILRFLPIYLTPRVDGKPG
ncbi:MAG: hypothetical protein COB67_11645 [SAR324 cluster bacterium]|uniref:NnrS family protein n=1 Tax=SAR324 cluster bacterium TaxID=2024889 RepID=A0A2A4SUH3_9DELT|nr:MAG: hypothetical protein COB67_11645 [SAR324 cluster bacterium]